MVDPRYSRRQVVAGGAAAIAAGTIAAPRRAGAADELNALIWCDHTS
jgi:hypothetical protein